MKTLEEKNVDIALLLGHHLQKGKNKTLVNIAGKLLHPSKLGFHSDWNRLMRAVAMLTKQRALDVDAQAARNIQLGLYNNDIMRVFEGVAILAYLALEPDPAASP